MRFVLLFVADRKSKLFEESDSFADYAAEKWQTSGRETLKNAIKISIIRKS